ncbi:GntP family permease [Nocardia cyriacigeorgica]|uniref:GntP family permease n=1 Tax=Nocardia cyriacigeorgica TaxID=135487 RepID=UPI002455DFAE|nr:SLC13 family permease [Nocardia cyriacigeorgica]
MSTGHLVIAAVAGIVVIVAAITWLKIHPFIALTVGAIGVGLGAGSGAAETVDSFVTGFGSTMGSVGILIGFGAMFGKLLADSGGATRVVDTLLNLSGPKLMPWTMGLVGAVIGLPMFFEIGVVLLMPVIILVARHSGLPLMRIAIPTLAGLSAMHGLVPPHPGPLVAVDALDANLGLTLAFGVLVAIPTVVVAGPLFGTLAARWVDVPVPELFTDSDDDEPGDKKPQPPFLVAIGTILLPVLFLAWLVAVLIRVATGSATVATVTASGILAPVAADLSNTHVSLMVLAIGSGSLFLSHVNDAGFWLVKEFLGLSVAQNLKSWTVMECLISVCGLAGVLALSVVV